METIHLDSNDPTTAVMRKAFPTYAGKKYKLVVREGPMSLTSYWDGGSRDYYQIIQLADGEHVAVRENGSGFVPSLPELPVPCPGYAVVEHSIFCGKDAGLTLYVHPDNAVKMLPAKAEMSWAEMVVLVATRSLKSSYGGRTRFDEAKSDTGITLAEWDAAKASLIARGMLNKAGAITTEGKNAAGSKSLWNLRRVAA